jgi:hypothetical protein
MNTLFSILIFSLSWLTPMSDPENASYWESKGDDVKLIQIIHTPDDQGRDVLHINMFLSSSCTTEIYYAMPLKENDLYVLTNTFGEVVESDIHICIKKQKKLKIKGRSFKKISKDKYFSEMKVFEKNLNK